MGDAPAAPAAPDYGAANSEGVFAQSALLPSQLAIQQAKTLGLSGTYQMPVITGNQITGYQSLPYDFTGLSDVDVAAAQAKNIMDVANQQAPALLDFENKYGTKFVEQNRALQSAADPQAFALREQLGNALQSDLSKGSDLTDAQKYNIEQEARRGQQARGGLFDPTAGMAESLAKFDVGERLKQQRYANAQAFAFGQPLATYNTSAAQQGAAPVNPLGYNTGNLGVDASAGNNAANFASNIYGTQSANYRASLQQQNPLMSMGLGLLGQGAGGLMSFGLNQLY